MNMIDRWIIGMCLFIIVHNVTVGDTSINVGIMLLLWFFGSLFNEIVKGKDGDDGG